MSGLFICMYFYIFMIFYFFISVFFKFICYVGVWLLYFVYGVVSVFVKLYDCDFIIYGFVDFLGSCVCLCRFGDNNCIYYSLFFW